MSRNDAFNAGQGRAVARLATEPEHANDWNVFTDDASMQGVASKAIVDIPTGSGIARAHITHSTPYMEFDRQKNKAVVSEPGLARVKIFHRDGAGFHTDPSFEFGVEAKTLKSAVSGTFKALQEMAQGTRPIAIPGTNSTLHPGHMQNSFPWLATGEAPKVSFQFKPGDIEAHARRVSEERRSQGR